MQSLLARFKIRLGCLHRTPHPAENIQFPSGVKTGEVMLPRDKSGGCLLTVQAAPGIEVA